MLSFFEWCLKLRKLDKKYTAEACGEILPLDMDFPLLAPRKVPSRDVGESTGMKSPGVRTTYARVTPLQVPFLMCSS